ncbi:MAG: aldo/keto reductase [Candidatus Zixiibacteriota bacterium]|nr:MAG: aldo/keto reductase [candidate division Zixibacteria bacterium]
MDSDFTHTTLGRTGFKVHRLGFSATYRPGKQTVHRALDAGLNYFFCYGFDTQVTRVLRDLPISQRDGLTIATGAYNLILGHPNLRRTLEKRLRQLRTDCVAVFLFLGVMKEKELTDHVREEMVRFREEGKVRAIGLSTHNRKLAGKLASEGLFDILMMRYNAAHRGAEQDIFPYLADHNPGVVSYTATRWKYLLRRPKGWPKDCRIPTAGECYRFVLSNPHVHVCMTAPSNVKQLEENLAAMGDGPLSEEDHAYLCKVGDAVHHKKKLLG